MGLPRLCLTGQWDDSQSIGRFALGWEVAFSTPDSAKLIFPLYSFTYPGLSPFSLAVHFVTQCCEAVRLWSRFSAVEIQKAITGMWVRLQLGIRGWAIFWKFTDQNQDLITIGRRVGYTINKFTLKCYVYTRHSALPNILNYGLGNCVVMSPPFPCMLAGALYHILARWS